MKDEIKQKVDELAALLLADKSGATAISITLTLQSKASPYDLENSNPIAVTNNYPKVFKSVNYQYE